MTWDPDQYRRFASERAQPFHDLMGMIERRPMTRAVDLGCGPGELTALAANTLNIGRITGVDSSPTMLEAAAEHVSTGVRFLHGDIAAWTSPADHDLVLANASLQWVPDHAAVLAAWTAALAPGGQLAVQVPANSLMPSHRIADTVARAAAFIDAFGEQGPPPDPVANNVLEPEEYASILFELGLRRQHVRLQIYPHVLSSSRDVVQWVRGTTLTRFQQRLSQTDFARFLVAYEAALLDEIGSHEPYFFPFRRILMWATVDD